ncbi:helix-turn-helix domain-containing protein [Pseudomonas aeruginosa]|uniref:AraC family transcriptional regulator n=2 Tax=Pseudomonadaceae TaxID=135621 RepID=A0ACC5VPH3_STUCH|nr:MULTISPECIES: AraC family transcriptional regulator [Pseudomonadaceae]MBG6788835.1 AraC family transcriptional regulator [Pseudomonas aeruginosa]MBH3799117.1 AraC family transcriptional regulator [Pseudomonas aeruginosa]MBH9217147.1 AraC family transcriptional regulator [Pseudomonas aeruginosa]MBL7581217.1 AraC family transcriptional regulator [Pseudomonas aeruginosa]MBT1078302.1 AraC family transcriptional regulator [Pseudomonas aeruginosa]
MQEKDSVSVYFVQAALHGLREQPELMDTILSKAGIEKLLLADSSARVSAAAFAKLWLAVAQELDDEFFGYDSHGMPVGSFALICRGLIQTNTLGQALCQCLASCRLFLRDIQGNLALRGNRAVISLHTRQEDQFIHSILEETFLTMVISLLCWLAGRRIPINRTQFGHPRPAHGDDHLLWGPDLTFEATHTEIEFEADYLKLPVVQDLASLKTFLRTAPQWVIIRFSNRDGLSAQVYRQLRNCRYEQWPTLADLACERNLSVASFSRQLQREGFSFQEIKDEVRRTIAFDCLRNTELSVAAIAEQAGFRETSAFHRAFKQWTGDSPGNYRLKQRATVHHSGGC